MALARDKLLPYSDYLEIIEEHSQTPNNTLYLITIFQLLYHILFLISLNAFNIIGGVCTLGYIIPYFLMITNKIIKDFDDYKI